MEREIIFRGKRVDNGEWVEGVPLVTSISGVYMVSSKGQAKNSRNGMVIKDVVVQHEVDHETVGQYTGIKDKNGKRIFEGDVLRRQGCSDVYIVFDKKTASSGWTFTDFIRSQGYIHQLNKYDTSLSEIIGNIHDNDLKSDA